MQIGPHTIKKLEVTQVEEEIKRLNPLDYKQIFLRAYHKIFEPKTAFGYKQQIPGTKTTRYFIIGSANSDNNIEGTLVDSRSTEQTDVLEILMNRFIGITYGTNDAEYTLTPPQTKTSWLYKKRIIKPKQPKIEDIFPILTRQYGSIVFIDGTSKISDQRLELITKKLSLTIKEILHNGRTNLKKSTQHKT